MKLFKKILVIVAVLLVGTYLVVAVTTLNRKPAEAGCRKLTLVIKDSVNAGFITQKEVLETLEQKGINPLSRPMSEINTRQMEEILAQNPLIDHVECYKTHDGTVVVEAYQRIPILRVMTAEESFYLDSKGTVMPTSTKCVAQLVVATGHIDQTFAVKTLYPFARFLQSDAFWRAQIEQINVLRDHTVELVPRVGDHLIYMGTLTTYQHKLDRLKRFYTEGLNRVGWNRYSRISVDIPNQIVCTKKK
ncbi:MAG: cell division protein FtsQ [Prevotellaceae bacterium]|jgi:cell division protein FtsQ|nr:cell division protein FtsQ [Prevotellaceae bacterium]